jgi:HYR domain
MRTIRKFSTNLGLPAICALFFHAHGAPAANLDQIRNGGADSPISPADWVNGNAGAQTAHYAEGFSIAYRCVMTELPLNTPITLVLEYDIKHSDTHAIDFLTHYYRLEPHDFDTHETAEEIQPLRNVIGISTNNTRTTFTIPPPSTAGSPAPGQPLASYNGISAGERLMTLFGGTINDIQYVAQGSLTDTISSTSIQVTFTADNATAVLLWGGHIASRLDWGFTPAGVPRSAGGINGSPYHMRLINWNLTNLGNQDRSLQAAAVAPPPSCGLQGPSNMCQGSPAGFFVQTDAVGATFNWSLLNNTAGATFATETTSSNVVVNAASSGQYEIRVEVNRNGVVTPCSQIVTVNANPSCLITGLNSVCAGATGLVFSGPPGLATYAWSVQGNATFSGPVTNQNVTVNAGPACPGTFTLTLTTTQSGCSSTCTKLVTTTDTVAPILSGVPANTTATCAALPTVPTVTATDNCTSSPAVIFTETTVPGPCPASYQVNRSWAATDACGNTVSAIQIITAEDTTPPVVTCSAAVTVQCLSQIPAPNISLVTATDNCAGPVVITHVGDVSNNQTCPTVINRTYRGVDDCGNETLCTQLITVQDTIAPVVTCPAAVTVQCIADVPAPNVTLVSATDNCAGTVTITHVGDVSNNQTCPTVITRTYRGIDDCGNETLCTQLITVQDTIAPVVTCPAAVTVECIADVPAPNTSLVVATDNCDANVTVTHVGDVSNGLTCPTVITRTYRGVDDCGNETLCTQLITVDDTVAPVVTCPAAVTVECITDVPAPTTSLVLATDNCDASVTVTHVGDVSNNQTCPTVITRTYRGVDDCGNETLCTQLITVDDTIAPVLSAAPADLTVECSAVPTPATLTATDNCDASVVPVFSSSTAPGNCPGNHVITRTWTATDACGNASSRQHVITVRDTTPPVISCPVAITVECGSPVPPPNTSSVTATDNCGTPVVTHVGDVSNGLTCPQVITRTYRAVDACGNATTCTQLITVRDTTAPVQTEFPLDQLVSCNNQIPTPVAPSVVDACDASLAVQLQTITQLSSVNCGKTILYRWTIRDDCNNFVRATQRTIVRDRTRPVITSCGPVPALTGDANCQAALPPVPYQATDNCGGVPVVTQNPPAGTLLGPGTHTVTLTAVDECGNTSLPCTVTVTVNCLPPSILVLKTVYLGHDGGATCPGIEKVWGEAGTPITYCFRVINNGQVNLSNVTITDPLLGIAPINVGSLAVGQWLFRSVESTIGQDLVNVASVTGTPPSGPPVTDDDPAEVDAVVPSIDIQKTVREGAGAPCPGFEEIFAVNGEPVTYCFRVTNTGNILLNDVVVTDPTLDIAPITIGRLNPGQAVTAAVNAVVAGSVTNIAHVTGRPPLGPPVTDEDPAKVFGFGPSMTFRKTVYAGQNGVQNCPGADEIAITGPTTVTYCFEIRNTGDGSIQDVVINDPLLGLNDLYIGPLSAGQVVVRSFEYQANGPVTNFASAIGDPPSHARLTNYSHAVVGQYAPSLQVNKTMFAGHGSPAGCLTAADTLTVPLKQPLTYCFEVVNTGDSWLNDVGINDASIGVDQTAMDFVAGEFPLPPGGRWLYTYKALSQIHLTNVVHASAGAVNAEGKPILYAPRPSDVDAAILTAPIPVP